jgi:hypothetical protein
MKFNNEFITFDSKPQYYDGGNMLHLKENGEFTLVSGSGQNIDLFYEGTYELNDYHLILTGIGKIGTKREIKRDLTFEISDDILTYKVFDEKYYRKVTFNVCPFFNELPDSPEETYTNIYYIETKYL